MAGTAPKHRRTIDLPRIRARVVFRFCEAASAIDGAAKIFGRD
jgi:hypothetical protein